MYLTLRICFFALYLAMLNGLCFAASAQSWHIASDSTYLIMPPDTISTSDSTGISKDTIGSKSVRKPRKTKIEAPVVYSSKDSLTFLISEKKVLLYKEANVTYQKIELKAEFIQFEMAKETVFASGVPDSTGKVIGNPDFKQDNEKFTARTLTYNFKNKKGYIEAIKSQQEGGYLHAEQTKRMANGSIDLKNGKYTTCDADHPHYYLALTKGISIPNDKIISGPAYLVLEDVPLPIGIPFGFFPNTKTSTSGVLIPSYGEEERRGFYLRGGGYYLALNEHWDAHLTGDIFSKGTWGANLVTNYKLIYRFGGSFSLQYYLNVDGEKGLPNYTTSHDFSVIWSHIQDAKANPTRTFSASVNFSTSGYDQNHSYDINKVLNNRKSSSISFTKIWKYAPFNFSASLNHTQNSIDKSFNLGLPKMSFNMGTIYPFRKINKSGREKWYDNIQLSYSSSLENNIYTTDSLLFTNRMFKKMVNGFQQSIPLSWNIKPINGFNIAPSLNYKGVMYTSMIERHWDPHYHYPGDTIPGGIVTDTVKGLYYAHSLYPSFSVSLNPKIYGMYIFRGERIQAIRHVITPSVGFSYIPNISRFMPDYYRTVIDSSHKMKSVKYSMFENGIYGTPAGNSQSASLNFSLRNTLEMKAKSPSDTSGVAKKINLLETFDFFTNYNIITHQWGNISFNTGTRLLNNKIDVRLNANIDPYSLDSKGIRTDILEWTKNNRIGRITNAQLSMTMNLTSGGEKKKTQQKPTSVLGQNPTTDEAKNSPLENNTGQYVDFKVPWTANISYSLTYNKAGFVGQYVQSIRVSGDLSITPKWKIGCNTGYDFQAMKITTTDISIYRDLHCWEMRFSVVPFGQYQSYNFYINVKSAILKDLKYNKSKSWYDNF